MDKILLTGFEPFGGETINPSWELVKLFEQTIIHDHLIISKQLPTVFKESAECLKNYIKEIKPNWIICLGQAGGSTGIRLERVALNLDDTTIADNKNNKPEDEVINPDGPNAYFTKLPVKAIKKRLDEARIPCHLSYSCGTFVCNHVFYTLIHEIQNQTAMGGFIHIPYLPQQVMNKANVFSMDLSTLQDALTIIIKTIINQ